LFFSESPFAIEVVLEEIDVGLGWILWIKEFLVSGSKECWCLNVYFVKVNKLKTLKEKIPLQTRSCVDTSVPSSITCMEKSISATGALFCIASIALRVCSYVPYETPVEAVGGDEEVVVDGPIDTEYIVQEVENTASQRRSGVGCRNRRQRMA
jgi:hypothetical protein